MGGKEWAKGADNVLRTRKNLTKGGTVYLTKKVQMHLIGRAMNLEHLLDDIEINEELGKIIDRLTVMNLQDMQDNLITSYENTLNGIPQNSFVINNPEEDAFEISRRIEAVDMILSWMVAGHKNYDFDAVEWWDENE